MRPGPSEGRSALCSAEAAANSGNRGEQRHRPGAELRSWVRLEAPATDGIPAAALGPLDRDARVPMRSFTGHPPSNVPPSARFEPLPQLATFTTPHDDRSAWIRTGMALERVWLLATARGLRASVLHQAVEWPDTRWQLRDPETGPGYVQIVLRLGYGPPGVAAPRRPVAEILQADFAIGGESS